jgi:hypothetical protein
MRFGLSLICCCFYVIHAFSQGDIGGGSIIAPIRSTTIPSPSSPISPQKNTLFPSALPAASTSKSIEIPSKINFNKRNQFINPGIVIEKKLNPTPEKEGTQVFRKNQYLGDVKTKGAFVSILCRDHEYVDGDQIRVYVNDILINEVITLNETFQTVEVALKKGFNKIEFEAINQGSSGPNTAEFRVYDDNESVISANQWNLATGFRATIIVVKE